VIRRAFRYGIQNITIEPAPEIRRRRPLGINAVTAYNDMLIENRSRVQNVAVELRD